MTPEISIVVCTRNRARYLRPTLDSLRRLHAPFAWELILVDSASDDDTAAVLAAFCKDLDNRARLVRAARKGLSVARNAGWRAAAGRIIAFTDDDCYPHEDFLIEIERAFSRSPQIDYLGGRILLHDPADLPTSIQTLDTMVALPARAFVPSGFIHGANFAMSRQLIERLDGFDNRLGAGAELIAGEDTDMLVRASASGATGRYVPDVVVEHHHRRQRVEEFQQMNRGYAIGRGAYLAKALLDSTAFDYALKKEYLRQWYWSACKKWGTPKRGEIAHEIYGAAKYIKLAITQGRHVST